MAFSVPQPLNVPNAPNSASIIAQQTNQPSLPVESSRIKIAKVSVALGNMTSSGMDRCLKTHMVQNNMHGYRHSMGTTRLVADEDVAGAVMSVRWTKYAFLMHILLIESQKPVDERLEGLFCFDTDTMILNPFIKLETFIPPVSTVNENNIKLVLARN